MRRTLHVELDISGTNLAFEAGDAICISCPNVPEEVDELLQLLGAEDIAGMQRCWPWHVNQVNIILFIKIFVRIYTCAKTELLP